MPQRMSQDAFLQAVSQEYTWRKHELNIFRTKIPSEINTVQKVLLRSSIPLIYSHWEGFVKVSTSKYLNFVSEQYHKNSELSLPFVALSLTHIMSEIDTNSIKYKTEIIKNLFDNLESRARVPKKNIINTKSNLRYDVLCDILYIIGIDKSFFENKKELIDSLVDTRNTIAHGEFKDITYEFYNNFNNEILVLIETLKNLIENSIVEKKYLKN